VREQTAGNHGSQPESIAPGRLPRRLNEAMNHQHQEQAEQSEEFIVARHERD
jgi:hypothetical protein